MHTSNIPTSTSCTLIFTILIALSASSSPFPNSCPKCGDHPVPYPLSTASNCGNSKYKLSCNKNGTLQFPSQDGFSYQITSINPSQNRLIISPPYIQTSTCQSSDLSMGGLTIDENSPFNISSRNTVMLFNCSDNIVLSPLNCSISSPCRMFEKRYEEKGCGNTICCSYLKDSAMTARRIRVRAGGCSAYTSVVDFKEADPVDAWKLGVELQWLPLSS